MGTLFVGLFGLPVAYEEYFGENRYYRRNTSAASNWTMDGVVTETEASLTGDVFQMPNSSIPETGPEFQRDSWSSLRHGCIVFQMLSTAGIFLSIGALTSWHMKLITDGETCVETHINKKERTRLSALGLTFTNPYHVTPLKNWVNFLGFNDPSRGWRHVLLPAVFPPNGDGLTWNTGSSRRAAGAVFHAPESRGLRCTARRAPDSK